LHSKHNASNDSLSTWRTKGSLRRIGSIARRVVSSLRGIVTTNRRLQIVVVDCRSVWYSVTPTEQAGCLFQSANDRAATVPLCYLTASFVYCSRPAYLRIWSIYFHFDLQSFYLSQHPLPACVTPQETTTLDVGLFSAPYHCHSSASVKNGVKDLIVTQSTAKRSSRLELASSQRTMMENGGFEVVSSSQRICAPWTTPSTGTQNASENH
jgi:hypothetical protein